VKHLEPTGKSNGPVFRSLNLILSLLRSFERKCGDQARIFEKLLSRLRRGNLFSDTEG
jgi:hypothetical protein